MRRWSPRSLVNLEVGDCGGGPSRTTTVGAVGSARLIGSDEEEQARWRSVTLTNAVPFHIVRFFAAHVTAAIIGVFAALMSLALVFSNGGHTAFLTVTAIAIAFVVAVAWRMIVLLRRRLPVDGVTIRLPTIAYSSGDVVVAEVSNTSGRSLSIGLVVERFRSIALWHIDEGGPTYDLEILFRDFVPIETGTSLVEFPIGPNHPGGGYLDSGRTSLRIVPRGHERRPVKRMIERIDAPLRFTPGSPDSATK